MDYIHLGKTGLMVSRICLGCMTYGAPAAGKPKPGSQGFRRLGRWSWVQSEGGRTTTSIMKKAAVNRRNWSSASPSLSLNLPSGWR
jgi:aryl-alcohol dehydrogenase-like predicted oxidoreductase